MAVPSNFEQDAMELVNVIQNSKVKYFPYAATEYGISISCQEDLGVYYQNLLTFTPWAISMYAASSNILKAIGDGAEIELGNYDQCLNVEVAENNSTHFRGQQCMATFNFKEGDSSTDLNVNNFIKGIANATGFDFGTSYSLAFCVPSSCSGSDVQFLLNDTLQELNINGNVTVDPHDCYQTGETQLKAADITIICMIALFSIALFTSTVYDIITSIKFQDRRKGSLHQLLNSFSVYTNWKKILDTSTNSDTMTCLHGLRFLSIFWILLGHTVYMDVVTPHINRIYLKVAHENISNMLILNATLATDTFFLLSGLLLTYHFMIMAEKKISYNIIALNIKRYIRLTPPYAFVIFFYATLLYRLGSGPMWHSQVGVNRDYCLENWWTNLLYINNYVNVGRMCLSQSWYLAMDTQLFWVSPIFLYSLAKTPRFGRYLLSVAILFSIMIPFVITFVEHLTATMLYNKDPTQVASVYLLIYTRAYARAGPYLIGVALGYILYKMRGNPFTVSKVLMTFGWITSIGSSFAVLFGVAVFYDDLHGYNALESSVYAGLHRSIWAISVGWVIFACVKDHGGPVNAVLSWKFFIPLSRLTYCIYLCHYIILLCRVGMTRTNGYLSEFNIIYDFAGIVLLSTLLATLISLAFEIPFINLIKISFGNSQGSTKESVEHDREVSEESLEITRGQRKSRTNLAYEPEEVFSISYKTQNNE